MTDEPGFGKETHSTYEPLPEEIAARRVTDPAAHTPSDSAGAPDVDTLEAELVAVRAALEDREVLLSAAIEREDREREAREAAEREREQTLAEWSDYRATTQDIIEAAEADNRRLRDALEDMLANVGGHEHWDSTQMWGAGCETCIRQRAAKERARAALAGLGETTAPQSEAAAAPKVIGRLPHIPAAATWKQEELDAARETTQRQAEAFGWDGAAAATEEASYCIEAEDCENEWHYWRCPKHPDAATEETT